MARLLVALVLGCLALQAVALTVSKKKSQQIASQKKFDWNHQTGGSIIKPSTGNDMPAPRTVWKGYWVGNPINTNPGGHNFATRRAVDFAIVKAKADKSGSLKAQIQKILRSSLDDLWKDKEGTVKAVSHLVFGNFQNELRVNIDGDGLLDGTAAAALLIRTMYGSDPDISLNGKSSKWWTKATGYSSANPIHAMLASDDKTPSVYTQHRSYNLMVEFVKEMLTDAITLLRKERDGTGDTTDWAKGLKRIGSVLHTIQDTAVTCTPKHWKLTGFSLRTARDCLPGDGHSVVEFFPKQGRWKITAMSDGVFYAKRHKYHAALDDIYEPGRVLDIDILVASKTRNEINEAYTQSTTALWGDLDPAYDGGLLLLDVIGAAYNGVGTPAALAAAFCTKYLEARYVSWRDLKMPSIAEAQKLKADANK